MTSLLLTALFLSCWISTACRPAPIFVPLGETRIVGTIKTGLVAFQPKEDPNGDYFIVTKNFTRTLYLSLWKIKQLELELKACQEKLDAK